MYAANDDKQLDHISMELFASPRSDIAFCTSLEPNTCPPQCFDIAIPIGLEPPRADRNWRQRKKIKNAPLVTMETPPPKTKKGANKIPASFR